MQSTYTITFTSTLSSVLMEWIKKRAKEENKTKRAILEEALRYYQIELKKRELEDGFKRVALDKEMHEMAEEGLGDYIDQLNRLGI